MCLPYLCIAAFGIRLQRFPAMLIAAIAVTTFDFYLTYTNFYVSRSGMTAIGLVWMPVVNIVLVGPAGFLAGIAIEGKRRGVER